MKLTCDDRFVRAAGIVDHIENGHCKVVSPEKLHAQRADLTTQFLQGKLAIEAVGTIPAIEAVRSDLQSRTESPHALDNDDGVVEGTFRPLQPEPRPETKGKARETSEQEEWPELGKAVAKLKVGSTHATSDEEKSIVMHKPSAQGVKFPLEARRIDRPLVPRIPIEDRCTFKDAAGNIIFDPHDPLADCSRFRNYDNKYKCYYPVCG